MSLFETNVASGTRAASAPKPAATFPATLAVVRVQAAGFESYSIHRRAGDGKFSVVTVRDIETDADLERWRALPQLRAVTPFTRLTIPGELGGADDLRRIGAELQADLVLAYTVDTHFKRASDGSEVTDVALGLMRTRIATVDSTVSAIVIDTRTGYVHGSAKAATSMAPPNSPWWEQPAVDLFRRQTERAAFDQFLDQFDKTWNEIVARQSMAQGETEPASSPH